MAQARQQPCMSSIFGSRQLFTVLSSFTNINEYSYLYFQLKQQIKKKKFLFDQHNVYQNLHTNYLCLSAQSNKCHQLLRSKFTPVLLTMSSSHKHHLVLHRITKFVTHQSVTSFLAYVIFPHVRVQEIIVINVVAKYLATYGKVPHNEADCLPKQVLSAGFQCLHTNRQRLPPADLCCL